MFVLNPGGAGGGGSGQQQGPGQQQFWFFAKLGLYFAAVRGVYMFFSAREDRNKALLN
jgi:hypothetical protein